MTFIRAGNIQRPALTLAGGILYVAYGSAADTDPYHGWIIGYQRHATCKLLPNHVFNTTPNATRERLARTPAKARCGWAATDCAWMRRPILFFEIANGCFDADLTATAGITATVS